MTSARRSFGWVRGTVRRKAQVRWLCPARQCDGFAATQSCHLTRAHQSPVITCSQQSPVPETKEEEWYIYNKEHRMRPRTQLHFCPIMVSDCTPASKSHASSQGLQVSTCSYPLTSAPSSSLFSPPSLCLHLPKPISLLLDHPKFIPGAEPLCLLSLLPRTFLP